MTDTRHLLEFRRQGQALVIQHVHVERPSPPRHLQTDVSQPHEPERLAPQLSHIVEAQPGERDDTFGRPDRLDFLLAIRRVDRALMAGDEHPVEAEHERHRLLSHRDRTAVWQHGHRNAGMPRCGPVDRPRRSALHLHELESRDIDELRAHPAPRREKHISTGHDVRQLIVS